MICWKWSFLKKTPSYKSLLRGAYIPRGCTQKSRACVSTHSDPPQCKHISLSKNSAMIQYHFPDRFTNQKNDFGNKPSTTRHPSTLKTGCDDLVVAALHEPSADTLQTRSGRSEWRLVCLFQYLGDFLVPSRSCWRKGKCVRQGAKDISQVWSKGLIQC